MMFGNCRTFAADLKNSDMLAAAILRSVSTDIHIENNALSITVQ